MEEIKKPSKLRLFAALLLVIGAGVFLAGRYRSMGPRPQGNAVAEPGRPQTGPGGQKKLPPAEVKKMREKFVSEMQFSDDQLKKMKEITDKLGQEEGPEALGKILRRMGPSMTQTQIQKARSMIEKEMQKQLEQASPAMTQADYEKVKAKMQQKLAEGEKPPPSGANRPK